MDCRVFHQGGANISSKTRVLFNASFQVDESWIECGRSNGCLWCKHECKKAEVISRSATVDGRNPAPVNRWFIPLFIGFQPSKVVQDFFHPQYVEDSIMATCRALLRTSNEVRVLIPCMSWAQRLMASHIIACRKWRKQLIELMTWFGWPQKHSHWSRDKKLQEVPKSKVLLSCHLDCKIGPGVCQISEGDPLVI